MGMEAVQGQAVQGQAVQGQAVQEQVEQGQAVQERAEVQDGVLWVDQMDEAVSSRHSASMGYIQVAEQVRLCKRGRAVTLHIWYRD